MEVFLASVKSSVSRSSQTARDSIKVASEDRGTLDFIADEL